jgi:hypothetical protein
VFLDFPFAFEMGDSRVALSTLADRIRATNDDSSSPYSISEAVAFGDFLSADQARVQLPTWASGSSLEKPIPKIQVRLWNIELNKPS